MLPLRRVGGSSPEFSGRHEPGLRRTEVCRYRVKVNYQRLGPDSQSPTSLNHLLRCQGGRHKRLLVGVTPCGSEDGIRMGVERKDSGLCSVVYGTDGGQDRSSPKSGEGRGRSTRWWWGDGVGRGEGSKLCLHRRRRRRPTLKYWD